MAQGRAPAPARGPVRGPLFQGTVYLANLTFTGPGGPWALAARDLATAAEYVQKVVGPISSYASQYGSARIVAGGVLPARSLALTGGQYSDADLQGWVNDLARSDSLPTAAAILVLNPPGVVNSDARESGGVGVLGYHGLAAMPYSFVNVLGTGFTLDDRSDVYAEAVSHELAEMTVDPRADDSNPEVCDGCGTNCRGGGAFRAFFDTGGRYLATETAFPPPIPYAFFLSAIARPVSATACPAPAAACAYAPP